MLGVFAILWLLFGAMRTAVLGALLALLNFTVFVQARIAMLDGFMAAFVVLGGRALLLWAMRARRTRCGGAGCSARVLLGLAVGDANGPRRPMSRSPALAFLAARAAATRRAGRGSARVAGAGRCSALVSVADLFR